MKIKIEGKIVKRGNSCFLLLPKPVLDSINKKEGDNIKVEVVE